MKIIKCLYLVSIQSLLKRYSIFKIVRKLFTNVEYLFGQQLIERLKNHQEENQFPHHWYIVKLNGH